MRTQREDVKIATWLAVTSTFLVGARRAPYMGGNQFVALNTSAPGPRKREGLIPWPIDLQEFQSLLAELSGRFANVPSDQFESEIESALRQLIVFLGFDRSSFAEITADGWASVLCSVTTNGAEPFPCGPLPQFFDWYVSEARSGKVIALRSIKDIPPGTWLGRVFSSLRS